VSWAFLPSFGSFVSFVPAALTGVSGGAGAASVAGASALAAAWAFGFGFAVERTGGFAHDDTATSSSATTPLSPRPRRIGLTRLAEPGRVRTSTATRFLRNRTFGWPTQLKSAAIPPMLHASHKESAP
jgi:hypothetical protein